MREPYLKRRYRGVTEPEGLTCYRVVRAQSDLYVCTEGDFRAEAESSLQAYRRDLEDYLESHPDFGKAMRFFPAASGAPDIVAEMAEASRIFDVGPMASVAGAFAQKVGEDLLVQSGQVIVENGGDIFLAGGKKRTVRVFAGGGKRSVDIIVEDTSDGVGICTSSAGVGPSFSMGAADAVTVLAETATIADAAASCIGNLVRSPDEIADALERASGYGAVLGAVIVAGGSVGAWGEIQIV